MISKILHLCWLSGDPYPQEIQKCLDSWKEKLPDYSVMLWDSSKVDVNVCNWTKQAYEKKKYAFVSDYVRFYALYNYGGIYLDSDVEVLKSFDDLLDQEFFFGYEYTALPEAAVVGTEKGLPWIKKCLEWYLKNDFLDHKGKERQIIAPLILKYGFESTIHYKLIDNYHVQNVCGGKIYPCEYFSPRNGYNNKYYISDKTYSVHHFKTAWLKKNWAVKIKKIFHLLFRIILGKDVYNKLMYKLRNFIYKSCKGF